MGDDMRKKTKPEPALERVKIDENWEDAVGKVLKKKLRKGKTSTRSSTTSTVIRKEKK